MNLRKIIIVFGIFYYSSTYSCQDQLLKPAAQTVLGVSCMCVGVGVYKIMNFLAKKADQEIQLRASNTNNETLSRNPLWRHTRNVLSGSFAALGFMYLSDAYEETTRPCS